MHNIHSHCAKGHHVSEMLYSQSVSESEHFGCLEHFSQRIQNLQQLLQYIVALMEKIWYVQQITLNSPISIQFAPLPQLPPKSKKSEKILQLHNMSLYGTGWMQFTTWLKSSICSYEINNTIIAHCHLHWLTFSFRNILLGTSWQSIQSISSDLSSPTFHPCVTGSGILTTGVEAFLHILHWLFSNS